MPYLKSGYIICNKRFFNSFSFSTICHELGHAVELEKYFDQGKKTSAFSDIYLEVASTTFELGADYYLKNHNIDPVGAHTLLNEIYAKMTSSASIIKTVYESDYSYVAKNGQFFVNIPFIYDDENSIIAEDGMLYTNDGDYFPGDYIINEKNNRVVNAYYEYPFRSAIIYGLGYYIALHMMEIKDKVDIKEYNKIFNNFILSKNEASIESLIHMLGISVDDFINCNFVENRIDNDIMEMKKRFK